MKISKLIIDCSSVVPANAVLEHWGKESNQSDTWQMSQYLKMSHNRVRGSKFCKKILTHIALMAP